MFDNTLIKTGLFTLAKNFLLGTMVAMTVLSTGLLMASSFVIEVNQVKLLEQLLLLSIMLAGAIFEEIIFRYYLFRYLTRITKSIFIAIVLSSIVFALPHLGNPNVTILAVFSHFMGGVVYASAYVLSRSLALPIGLHFGWNYAQVMLSLPMSGSLDEGWFMIPLSNNPFYGDLYGIEGGWISILFRVIILTICLLLFYKVYSRRNKLKIS